MVQKQRTRSKVITVSLTPGQALWVMEQAKAAGLSIGQWLKAFVWENRSNLKPVKHRPHGELKTEKFSFRVTRQQYQAIEHYAAKLGWEWGLGALISYSLFPTKPKPDGRRRTLSPEEKARFEQEHGEIMERIERERAIEDELMRPKTYKSGNYLVTLVKSREYVRATEMATA